MFVMSLRMHCEVNLISINLETFPASSSHNS
jgi:hypothetical protein